MGSYYIHPPVRVGTSFPMYLNLVSQKVPVPRIATMSTVPMYLANSSSISRSEPERINALERDGYADVEEKRA